MELTIDVDATDPQRAVLVVAGSLDIESRAALVEAARAAMNDQPAALVLDFAALTFMDSTGIGALVEVAGEADERGIDFAIRNPSQRAARVLDVTGLGQRWIEAGA